MKKREFCLVMITPDGGGGLIVTVGKTGSSTAGSGAGLGLTGAAVGRFIGGTARNRAYLEEIFNFFDLFQVIGRKK